MFGSVDLRRSTKRILLVFISRHVVIRRNRYVRYNFTVKSIGFHASLGDYKNCELPADIW